MRGMMVKPRIQAQSIGLWTDGVCKLPLFHESFDSHNYTIPFTHLIHFLNGPKSDPLEGLVNVYFIVLFSFKSWVRFSSSLFDNRTTDWLKKAVAHWNQVPLAWVMTNGYHDSDNENYSVPKTGQKLFFFFWSGSTFDVRPCSEVRSFILIKQSKLPLSCQFLRLYFRRHLIEWIFEGFKDSEKRVSSLSKYSCPIWYPS